MPSTVHLVYFSPTGTTRKVCEGIAQGLGGKHQVHHDVTLPGAAFETVLTDGVAIIGVPVYSGRVPELCLQRLRGITSTGVPAVLVALYGNRAFEDALVELRDVALATGFKVIAAAAFIGEHSFSTPTQPIAAGRPDAGDLRQALRFGNQVASKIETGHWDTPVIPGNLPYKEGLILGGMAPETNEGSCTRCAKCAAVCPSGVIAVADSIMTDADGCIRCCACVRACETTARSFNHPKIEASREFLRQNCGEPKQPEIFMASTRRVQPT